MFPTFLEAGELPTSATGSLVLKMWKQHFQLSYSPFPVFFLIEPVQQSQRMKTYQMPCLRRAASQSKLSTSLTVMKDPTQVFWTVETVPGLWFSSSFIMITYKYLLLFCWLSIQTVNEQPHPVSWTSFCVMSCGDGSQIVLVSRHFLFSILISDSCFLRIPDQTQITLICQWQDLQRQAQKPFYLCSFFFFLGSLAVLQNQ